MKPSSITKASQQASEMNDRSEQTRSASLRNTVAVVILNWNGGDDIQEAVKSIFDSTHKQLEVVIVDNGSADGSSDRIRSLYPQVHFIRNPQNLGFARGSNQGISWSLGRGMDYVLLLNGDARVHSRMIEELLRVVKEEHESVAACPKMYLANDMNGSNRLWFGCGSVCMWAGLFRNPAHNRPDSSLWSIPKDMEFASGCCIMIPRKIFRCVGQLDEAFFAYCEDIDFSLRVRKAGFHLRYVPSALLWHGSASSRECSKRSTYRYLTTRNGIWTVRKHASSIELAICLTILPLRSVFRVVRALQQGEGKMITAEWRGVWDGLTMSVNR